MPAGRKTRSQPGPNVADKGTQAGKRHRNDSQSNPQPASASQTDGQHTDTNSTNKPPAAKTARTSIQSSVRTSAAASRDRSGMTSRNGSEARKLHDDMAKTNEELKAALEKLAENRELKKYKVHVVKSMQNEANLKIPWPTGEHGKAWKLQEAMGLSENTAAYNEIIHGIHGIMDAANLELDKYIQQQDRVRIGMCYSEAKRRFPILAQFENNWATHEIVRQALNNRRKRAKKNDENSTVPGATSLTAKDLKFVDEFNGVDLDGLERMDDVVDSDEDQDMERQSHNESHQGSDNDIDGDNDDGDNNNENGSVRVSTPEWAKKPKTQLKTKPKNAKGKAVASGSSTSKK